MDLLEDVAACRGFAQRLLPAFGESPRRGREALREPEPLEMHEPGDERGRLDGSGSVRKANLDAAILGAPLELAIERRETGLRDLLGPCALDVDLLAGAEFRRGDLLRVDAKATRNVGAGEPYLAAVSVDAADDYVRVGVVRIVVIDRCPLKLAIDVPLHRGHEAPNVRRQIELGAVLGRDDEPELVLLARAGPLKGAAVYGAACVVEHALGAVPLDAVSLDVAQVQGGSLGAARFHAEQLRLDDDAARARTDCSTCDMRPGTSRRAAQVREDSVAQ